MIKKNLNNIFMKSLKELLDPLIGNELVMQKRISLSIQFPKDKSSLLPIHSDTWSGLSPFEAVAWLPLVNCYKTKSMYILPPPENKKFINKFKNYVNSDSQKIFKIIKKKSSLVKFKIRSNTYF